MNISEFVGYSDILGSSVTTLLYIVMFVGFFGGALLIHYGGVEKKILFALIGVPILVIGILFPNFEMVKAKNEARDQNRESVQQWLQESYKANGLKPIVVNHKDRNNNRDPFYKTLKPGEVIPYNDSNGDLYTLNVEDDNSLKLYSSADEAERVNKQ